ncbi:acyltransferase family protein [Ancylobacter sp. TS-1]|uniref:acyltransferase family protein n=1 Tax=Ancylobacter sp. TS-1 TaxID=1850374 RepID=UPI001265C5AC|nr:acyltransferase family protein [Ancylobacter sp. TS-1]QFR31847.1 acyltransferase family protein [Ancylobacter sp. TS-1]
MHHHLRYRAHIDGLRAVAVLGVVLFHFGADWLPGGFTGVDVFFVISGFLIFRTIFSDIAAGTFSLAGFYERRIRRLVPAFAAVTLATSALAALILYPSQLVGYGRSLVWATFAAGNIFFYRQSDYFGPSAEELPLLHYWSLGVEEQFYAVFPLLLLVCYRLRARAVPLLVAGLLVASLIACEIVRHTNPSAAFYLLPYRAFELLIGAAIALPGVRYPRHRAIAGAAVAAGALLILAGMLLITASSPFPGLLALVPCLGAALVIWGGDAVATLPSRVLGAAPMRFYGAISYSLYLVHWPAVVFGHMLFPDADPLVFLVVGLAGSTAAGWLSWRYVEQPVRIRPAVFTRRILYGGTAAAGLALAGFAGVVVAAGGFPGSRYDAEIERILAYQNYGPRKEMYREGTCFLRTDQTAADIDPACLPTTRPNAILWGSSHIAQFFAGLEPELRARGYAVGQITGASCLPLVGVDLPGWPSCRGLNEFALDWLLRNRPTMVILGGDPLDMKSVPALDASVAKLVAAGIEVVVVGPAPYYRRPVPAIIVERVLAGKTEFVAQDDFLKNLARVDDRLRDHFAAMPGVHYVSVLRTMCPDYRCKLAIDGVPLHFDVVHFTLEGSRYYGRQLAEAIFGPVAGAAPAAAAAKP